MWAFLFLAGLFSGWWGALSFAAPPAANIVKSVSGSKDTTIVASGEDNTLVTRTLPFALTVPSRDNRLAGFKNHLEPYRYSSRHRQQGWSRSTLRRTPEESIENINRRAFRRDSFQRLRYGEDILDENASNSLETSPGSFEQGIIVPSYPFRNYPSKYAAVTSSDRRSGSIGVYQDANLELDNFMNYQVTPTSLRSGEFDPEDSKNRDNYLIMFENARDYRRRHQTTTDRVYSTQDDPRIEEEIDNRSEGTALVLYPSVVEPNLAPSPYRTTQRNFASSSESAMERPRVTRAASNQSNRKRTKANSPREQRRQSRNKERRGQNWCPDADIGNRAYLAPTVFEGKARSMSSVRKPGSNYAVTFEVKQVYKSQPGFQPLLKNDSVRLHFRDKVPGKSTLCSSTDASGQDSQGGIVRANIKRGKVYLVFVSRVGPRNFTILGEPMIRSKKNAQAVQAVIRPDYVREVTLSELRDAVARLREKVKLVCRTRGSPPPRVHWLKDGVPLHPRRGLRIQHKRRRSKVVIASARAEDSGQYECVAESTSGHRAALAAELLVTRAPETTTAAWPRQEAPCPISEDFCMNGGTCLFFETVGEPACRCAEGFTGLRCENKDVTSTGKFTSVVEVLQLVRIIRVALKTPAFQLTLDKPSASLRGTNFWEELFYAGRKFGNLNPFDVVVENFISKD